MSLEEKRSGARAPEEEEARAADFFIPVQSEGEWGEDSSMDPRNVILRKADALAAQDRLKEAIEMFCTALRLESVRPEQLGTLVDCIVRGYRRGAGESGAVLLCQGSQGGQDRDADCAFDCPGCHRFMGEPVTVGCGHSYCRGCLHGALLPRCQVCGEDMDLIKPGETKPNVVLSALLEKWFPEEVRRAKRVGEAEALLRSRHLDQAAALASELLESDPNNVRLRVCRGEVYRSLRLYHQSLDDWDMCLSISPSLEGYYCKAKVLQEMGRVDESLQLFLQCLAVDENFQQAKEEVEKILHDLLSPACESMQASLRETKPSAHLRSKATLLDAQVNTNTHPASIDSPPESSELSSGQKLGRSESLERSGLSRAHSLRAHPLGGAREEGLKRVFSAPQLGDQEKGALLKRKLSGSEAGPGLVNTHSSKHKKQGAMASAALAVSEETEPSWTVPRDLLDPNDFECPLCMRLFYEPVTTPCGHTFCKNCLERCLDHSPQCPLCKESLKMYLASRKYAITQVLDDIIKQYLSEEHVGRQKLHTEETKELSDLQKNVPIFVCTMAYPTVPCPLHVFEPRYRLMIRRCMETGTRQFGMCINDAQKGFADYGCMLHIRSIHFLPDGRSVVDTIGGKRFRVLSRSMRDGYCTANIEYLQDQRVVDEDELDRLQDLYDQVYNQAKVWFHTLENRFRNQILQHFGQMPDREADIQATPNGPACCWWLLAVLPVDPRYQLSLLSMTTLRERLVKIQHILTYLQNTHTE
ncbi:LON peptidase N-terminal domain and ring finger 1, like [Colossoma macropomum]|uniref:LON peptidase N-terminal domain and ring finger 1, like n=1 Tax=Colossoma macropomum TaxID=42526 RepID=UPI0018654567|nr:LON peptidase N-terminal domain and ring finger 1, like [Colossoma macropomum]